MDGVEEVAGGTDEMIKISKEQYETIVSADMKYVSIKPNKPSKIMLGGGDLHAIISQEVITEMSEERYKKTGYYLASSSDEGKTWTFVDLDPYDAESIKTFVPTFSGELEIPTTKYAEKIDK